MMHRVLAAAQAVTEDGVYAQGSVTVSPYPVEVHGVDANRTLPLRRLERVVTDDEGAELIETELQKARSALAS